MQQKYAEKMQFVLVGLEDKNIRRTYKRFEDQYKLSFPVLFDSTLDRQLGTSSFPTYLWIDNNGVLQAITNAPDMTEENLSLFLQNKPIFKFTEHTTPFDYRKPYLVNGNGGRDSTFLFRSLFTKWEKGQPIWFPPRITHGTILLQVLGAKLDQLYRYAFAGTNSWEITDSMYGNFFPMLLFHHNDSIVQSSATGERYCYSLMLPEYKKSGKSIQVLMQEDLERYLPYHAQIETRLMPYWSLQLLTNDTTVLSTRYKKPGPGVVTHSGFDVTCFPIDNLIPFLIKYYPLGIPIINETGMKGNIDLKIEGVLSEYNTLKKTLQQASLDLVEKKKPMKVVVLYER